MLLLKYLLMFTGIGMLLGAAGILAWDLYRILKPREPGESKPVRWDHVKRLAAYALAPLFAALSIAVVPSGSAAVRVNQFLGTRPKTLYPGVHLVFPLIESLKTYDIRDNVFATSMADDVKKQNQETLKVQTREGLIVGMSVQVRYRLDASKLAYINANLPEPLEDEMIAPAVTSTFRDLA